MFNISVNLKDKKMVDHIWESLLDVQSIYALYVIYQLLQSSCLSILMFIGTLCNKDETFKETVQNFYVVLIMYCSLKGIV